MDKCRSCQANIIWIKSKKAGKPIPCDTQKMTIVTEDGSVVVGYRSHFGTCPEADQWRKKGGKRS